MVDGDLTGLRRTVFLFPLQFFFYVSGTRAFCFVQSV
jgi:hypothetical protein